MCPGPMRINLILGRAEALFVRSTGFSRAGLVLPA
jgi:hypothetical protein